MTHERARTGDGSDSYQTAEGPGPIRALLVSEDLFPETAVTVAPRALWATAGRLARSLGRAGVEDRFLDDDFWTARVEQPRPDDWR